MMKSDNSFDERGRSFTSTPIDTKELELPETLFIRDIENRVFQRIVLHCLSTIEGVAPLEGDFLSTLFGKGSVDGVKGIEAEQDQKNRSIHVKIEVSVAYGVSIPSKAEEIQNKVADQITRLTGLHVGSVHVVFKNVMTLTSKLVETHTDESCP